MFGPYIYLALEVLKILLIFLVVYSPVLIAFILAFNMFLPNNINFADPITSFGKIFAMMLGELEYKDNFYYDHASFGSSTCALTGFFWLVSNVIYLKLTKV